MAWNRTMNLLVGAVYFQGLVIANDWPQFRGPNNSGVMQTSQAPSQWSDTTNVAWTQEIPGYGWSSPIVVGDKVVVTTAIAGNQKRPQPSLLGNFGFVKAPDAVYRWEVCCLDRNTGKKLWSQTALQSKPRIATTSGNTYASETPVSDGECVYAYFGMHGIYCYDLNGKKLCSSGVGLTLDSDIK